MTCAPYLGALGIVGKLPPQDDDDDRGRKPPKPEPPKPPSGADIARDLVKDVKDPIPETEDAVQE